MYALACQYQCHDAVRLAAKHSLALPALTHKYVPDLEKIQAAELYRLIMYRDACVAAACALADDHTWIRYLVRCSPSRKYPDGRLETMAVYRWWMEYMRKSCQALQKSPRGDAVKDKELVDDVFWTISSSRGEQSNALQVWMAFQSFVDAFAEKIDSQVAKARSVSPIC